MASRMTHLRLAETSAGFALTRRAWMNCAAAAVLMFGLESLVRADIKRIDQLELKLQAAVNSAALVRAAAWHGEDYGDIANTLATERFNREMAQLGITGAQLKFGRAEGSSPFEPHRYDANGERYEEKVYAELNVRLSLPALFGFRKNALKIDAEFVPMKYSLSADIAIVAADSRMLAATTIALDGVTRTALEKNPYNKRNVRLVPMGPSANALFERQTASTDDIATLQSLSNRASVFVIDAKLIQGETGEKALRAIMSSCKSAKRAGAQVFTVVVGSTTDAMNQALSECVTEEYGRISAELEQLDNALIEAIGRHECWGCCFGIAR